MSYDLITILGPTAVGKTKLAARIAFQLNGEIISADSRQVFKKMDIGTGKDLSDYLVNNTQIQYYLIDILNPAEEFNVFQFQKLFYEAFEKINKKGKVPFLVGGTGLYLNSIISNYQFSEVRFNEERINELNKLSIESLTSLLKSISKNLHNTTDLKIKERVIKAIIIAEHKKKSGIPKYPIIKSLNIGIKLDRKKIKQNITERLKYRLQNGMIEEVQSLLDDGLSFEKLMFFGLEYKYIGQYLIGEINYNDMFQKLNSAIHKFAKRQMTWFRKMEREGIKINWINGPDFEAAMKIISEENIN